ncbi:MAG: secretin N-terminal domain-containing protein [Alphaproteobacteria bacterium]|nr:secretin N-terminal domain-containing protein [Alphaproteobacteria bacterium]
MRLRYLVILQGVCCFLAACAATGTIFDKNKHDLQDPRLGLTRDDYRDLYKPTRISLADKPFTPSEPPIPEVSQILSAPRPPGTGSRQLVTLSVTEDVPLKDVLVELARLANVDLELDPNIKGGIIFSARDKSFDDVIERITQIANLRYSIKNGVLRVERDLPYVTNYNVDFLNIDRSSKSSLNVNTNVLSSTGGAGSSGSSSSTGSGATTSGNFNSGTTTAVESKYESDLWKSFESGMKSILGEPSAILLTQEAKEDGEEAVATARPAGGAEGAGDTGGSAALGKDGFYVVNKQGGLVTVSATSRKHRQVQEYIARLRASAAAQVLIEAKIVEVTLADRYRSGIQWNTLPFAPNLNAKVQLTGTGADITSPLASSFPTNLVALSIGRGADIGIDAVVNLLSEFGTSRTLSSPRLHAINNQQAVLTFAQNQVYFEIEVQRETNTTTTTSSAPRDLLTVESNIKTVPIGIILSMQPSINTETNEVTLSVRPTLSRVTGSKPDPAVAFLASQVEGGLSGITNAIPEVEVREIDSILKIRSGEVMVIGGLMEERNESVDTGVPYLSTIPYVGNAFKNRERETSTVEMVILIKATVLAGGEKDEHDSQLYRNFTADPRPLAF